MTDEKPFNPFGVRDARVTQITQQDAQLLADLAQEKPVDDTSSSLDRLREDLAQMQPGSQHAQDLRKVLGEFDDMRSYLHWELITAEQAAVIYDGLTDDKMVSNRRHPDSATIVPSEFFDELQRLEDVEDASNERTRAAAGKLHEVVRTDQDIADETFGTFETLLEEWFDWWRSSDEAPAKMDDALHVRTAMALMMREVNKAKSPEERAEIFDRMQERLLGPTPVPYVAVSNDELRFEIFRTAAAQPEQKVKVTHLPTGHIGRGATKEEALMDMYGNWGVSSV
jgi:hypothetical protein